MGRPVLILGLLALSLRIAWGVNAWAAPPAVAPARTHCLSCHRPHYPTRGGCVSCHRGNAATDRKQVAHAGLLPAAFVRFTLPGDPEVARGRDLMERSGCRRCHITKGAGTRLAADLDRLYTAPPGRIRDAISVPAASMPDFRFSEDSIRSLVNALYANGGLRGGSMRRAAEIPLKVHFNEDSSEAAMPPFSKYCGGCHRALTEKSGGLGHGSIGPNLSGLFTPFHPGRPGADQRWTPEALARWVVNPRALRPRALMPPVLIPAEAFPALADSLRTSGYATGNDIHAFSPAP